MEIETPQLPEKDRSPTAPYSVFRGPYIKMDFIDGTSFHGGPISGSSRRKIIFFSLMASVIDILVGVAMSLLGVAAMALFVRSNFSHVLEFFDGSIVRLTGIAFIGLVAAYKVIMRAFLGFTLGEWACGLRMGTPHARHHKNYVPRVLLRALIVFATGIVTMSILSLVLGFDVAGKISGLYLYQVPPPQR